MSYTCYLDGVAMPVTPSKLTVKIKNKNKTLILLNEGEINFLRTPGLTELVVPLTFPMLSGGRSPEYYLGILEKLKSRKKKARFILVRTAPNGKMLYDTNMRVSVEDYNIVEDAKEGLDVSVDVNLNTQWTRSPRTVSTTNSWGLNADGNIYSNYCSNPNGSRPAFTLPSSLSVSDDSSVSVNTAPTITGSSASGSNLGTKTAGFNFTYQVNDVDGNTVTVKEYLDNVVQRTYTATLGATNTFQCVTAANFQTILNGAHTLKIVANDGKADSAAYTVTFTKLVTTATITLATPLPADDIITVMVMNLVGSLPADASLSVLVTNNAKDSSPKWEDATADIKNGNNHIFTNKTAANGFAFNFKLTVSRGSSNEGGYISNIGGAFE